ncbi:SlyX family protein [Salinicola avicenniae]|uniref:SlyX family protein n=1 Tax=Salinicola avicenniae TaxID=2916836 RepID=UPI002074042E|nr:MULTISPECIES: SlyX family protein [unclassified Salinicola]
MKDDTQPAKSTTSITTSGTSLEARLEALESRLAFQEDWLETLDKLVREQSGETQRLGRLNELLQQRLREQRQAIDDMGADLPRPEDELPPHY